MKNSAKRKKERNNGQIKILESERDQTVRKIKN